MNNTKIVDYQVKGIEIGQLLNEKQAAYGDSFGKSGEVLRILYPGGIRPDQYDDALAIVRVIDKLFRVATHKDAFGEDPWRDIAGYGILAVSKRDRQAKATSEKTVPNL